MASLFVQGVCLMGWCSQRFFFPAVFLLQGYVLFTSRQGSDFVLMFSALTPLCNMNSLLLFSFILENGSFCQMYTGLFSQAFIFHLVCLSSPPLLLVRFVLGCFCPFTNCWVLHSGGHGSLFSTVLTYQICSHPFVHKLNIFPWWCEFCLLSYLNVLASALGVCWRGLYCVPFLDSSADIDSRDI